MRAWRAHHHRDMVPSVRNFLHSIRRFIHFLFSSTMSSTSYCCASLHTSPQIHTHWCRVLAPGESSISADEQSLLDRICEAYYLPTWCSVADYEAYFKAEGLTDIQTADWSNEVAPFWGAVIQSALTPQGVAGLMQAGWTTIKVRW